MHLVSSPIQILMLLLKLILGIMNQWSPVFGDKTKHQHKRDNYSNGYNLVNQLAKFYLEPPGLDQKLYLNGTLSQQVINSHIAYRQIKRKLHIPITMSYFAISNIITPLKDVVDS